MRSLQSVETSVLSADLGTVRERIVACGIVGCGIVLAVSCGVCVVDLRSCGVVLPVAVGSSASLV